MGLTPVRHEHAVSVKAPWAVVARHDDGMDAEAEDDCYDEVDVMTWDRLEDLESAAAELRGDIERDGV